MNNLCGVAQVLATNGLVQTFDLTFRSVYVTSILPPRNGKFPVLPSVVTDARLGRCTVEKRAMKTRVIQDNPDRRRR
jgi:hypothetical protein